jgi:3-oxoacyl-[acyl-carrier-protein] synthase III
VIQKSVKNGDSSNNMGCIYCYTNDEDYDVVVEKVYSSKEKAIQFLLMTLKNEFERECSDFRMQGDEFDIETDEDCAEWIEDLCDRFKLKPVEISWKIMEKIINKRFQKDLDDCEFDGFSYLTYGISKRTIE